MSGMHISIAQQRCWNHELREAVCRCPECRRSFCRECVTEHDARLLCASCLRTSAESGRTRGATWGRVLPVGMAFAGILVAWFLFFGAGETLAWIVTRMEQTSWHSR